MKDVDRPDPKRDATDALAEMIAVEVAAIGQDGGKSGEDHKELSRVRVSEVLLRDRRPSVLGLIDENRKERYASHKVDPQVALDFQPIPEHGPFSIASLKQLYDLRRY
jgi:hypothetical protein